MNELSTGLSAPAFRDRRTSLIVFGILVILLGCLCALIAPLMVFSQVIVAQRGGGANYAAIIPGVVTYLAMAVAMIWLGIGSIMERRWARALLLILGWSWLAVGVFSLAMMFMVIPRVLAQMPPEARMIATAVALVMLGVIFLVVYAVALATTYAPAVRASRIYPAEALRYQ